MPRSRAPMSTLTTGCGDGVSAAASGVTAARPVNSGRMSSGRNRERGAIVWPLPERCWLVAKNRSGCTSWRCCLARVTTIKETAFFVDLRWLARGYVGGDAAIDEVQHIDRLPFLALGRMDCRQDQIILVEFR